MTPRTRTLGSRLPREPIALRLLRPRQRRDALVLSGGGSRAGFEIGALRYLYDVVGIEPSVITGTSAGSVLAAVLAQGTDAGERRRCLEDLERIWRSLTTSSDMFQETDWFAALRRIAPEWVEVFQRRRRLAAAPAPVWLTRPGTRGEEDVDAPADAPLWAPFRSVEALLALRTLGRTGRDLERVLDSADRSQGVFVPGRVAELIQDPSVFDPERVARSGVRLRIAVVGLESGELRYVTEEGRLVDRADRPVGDAEPVELADAVRASSAIPVVFPPVRLGAEHYVDGGVREVLPLGVSGGESVVHHDDGGLTALKHRLRDLVAAKGAALLPDGADLWWTDWEAHAWPTPRVPAWGVARTEA